VAHVATYPVKVEAHLDPGLSRWLWLVKWVLAIPHFIVLAFLWIAFFALSVVAFFSILFTGRYPRAIFDFNVGVMRWSWRVAYYAYGALGTDSYPPFTLAEVEGYPAHLEVRPPEQLSRGLVLIKWWLLVLPHYLIVAALAGGAWFVWQDTWRVAPAGMIGVLAFAAGLMLMFTGAYPRGLFDLILGLNRWVLRVAAYAGLMTDEYPPFRLDMGGTEDGSSVELPAQRPANEVTESEVRTEVRGWTAGPIMAMVIGSLSALLALGALGTGGALLWADQTQRDATGFLSTPEERFDSPTYAVVAEDIVVHATGPDRFLPQRILDRARVRVSATDGSSLFIGLARAEDAAAYLDGTAYATTGEIIGGSLVTHPGVAPSTRPTEQSFWVTSSSGAGQQTIRWEVESGHWTLVVMRSDGVSGVDFNADIGATIPALTWIAVGSLGLGGILVLVTAGLMLLAVRRAGRPARGRAS
jgi:hypothetical protein